MKSRSLRTFVPFLPQSGAISGAMNGDVSYIQAQARAFWAGQAGAVSVKMIVALVATIAMVLVVGSVNLRGGQAAVVVAPADPVEIAVADLLERPMQSLDETQLRVRLARHLDPAQRSAAQLRHAHRVWAGRMMDSRFADRGLAHDMAAITQAALALRGLSPAPSR